MLGIYGQLSYFISKMSNMVNSSKTGQPNSDKNLQVQLENGRLVSVNENKYL